MKSKRIKWLDFVKGLCIFMVVLYHVIYFSGTKTDSNNLSVLLSNPEIILKYMLDILMLPAFFAISGYLYKSVKSLNEYFLLIYKKIISFIIPYLIFYIMFAITYSNNFLIFKIYMMPKRILMHPNGDLWFLWVLFIIFMVIGFIDLLHVNKFFQILLFGILFVIFIFIGPYTGLGLRIQHAILQMGNVLFFLLGELLKRHINWIKRYNKLLLWLFLISFLIMINTPFYYDAQFISINTIIPKILGIFMMFGLASQMNETKPVFKYFTRYGRYTLIIYIIHFEFLFYVNNILNDISQNLLLKQVISLILIWYLSKLVCYLSNKFKVINFMFYPRKYIDLLFIKTKVGMNLLRK